MLRLVFDTSSPSVSLGLLTEEGWMEYVDREDIPKQQSKIFFQLIQELINPFGIEKKEIKEIAVGEGPGSYTGLRMGMTVAKIWAYAHKVDLYTFSSSELLAKTRVKEPDAKYPKIQYLEIGDYKKLSSLEDLKPVYENDHFAGESDTPVKESSE